MDPGSRAGFRRTVIVVAVLNLSYFGVEFVAALAISSVSLLADSIDFLEDTAMNLLIVVALGWSAARREWAGKALALILLVPALSALWMAASQLARPHPPHAFALSATGLGALAVNLFCAFLLVQYRHHSGSLSRAAWLSARNDAFANLAVIAAGPVTAATLSIWPDLIVGLGIAALNAGAAREVWLAAKSEPQQPTP